MRRMHRSLGITAVLGGFLTLGLLGCGGGGELSDGTPENIDMTKSYTPDIVMPGMSPKIQRESAKKAASATPPAPTP